MVISLAAEPLFHIGTFPVTNTLIMGVLVTIVLLILGSKAGKRVALIPARGIAHVMEATVDALLGFMDSVTHDRERSLRFFPYVATIFLFVIFSNWIELVPGLGTIGVWGMHHGEEVIIPFIRSASADLNVTLAIALFSVVATQVVGVAMVGGMAHIGKFISFKNPIAFFVGILELVSEFAKVISFSFRLFGNIFAGEVLLIVVTTLVPYVVPLPFLLLELFVGFIQALVFAVLTLVNLNMAASHAAH
ncbi:MAG: FoF1 ATP synthase subunit a [bacterium]|nr:FoF1 ATP synthase subunit a [bacterium]